MKTYSIEELQERMKKGRAKAKAVPRGRLKLPRSRFAVDEKSEPAADNVKIQGRA